MQPRHIAAAVIGNALEVYDFATYTYFAVSIGQAFFPSKTSLVSLLLSLATFGVGFVSRPIGALVIGAYADRAGRRPAMLLSIALMGIGVLILALTPPYAMIGSLAPFLVVSARLIQGFALGGEIGPATAYLVEAAPAHRRGFYGGWQLASQGLSTLTAGIIGVTVSSLLSTSQMALWGWRVPFLIGASILPLGLLMRRNLPETMMPSDVARQSLRRATVQLFASHGRVVILGFLVILGTTIPFYVLSYMTTYAVNTLHMGTTVSLGATVVLGACNVAFSLIGGHFSDRFGRKPLMIWPRVLLVFAAYPVFAMMIHMPTAWALLSATAILATLNQLSSGVGIVIITESLPKAQRSAALAVIYALAVAIFGGTTQFVITWLIGYTGNPLAPAWYLMGASVIGIAAMGLMTETVVRTRRRPGS